MKKDEERTVTMSAEVVVKTTNHRRVYCCDCKHYECLVYGLYSTEDKITTEQLCRRVIGYVDTPFCREPLYAEFDTHNADNDCPYYEPEITLNPISKRRLWDKLKEKISTLING